MLGIYYPRNLNLSSKSFLIPRAITEIVKYILLQLPFSYVTCHLIQYCKFITLLKAVDYIMEYTPQRPAPLVRLSFLLEPFFLLCPLLSLEVIDEIISPESTCAFEGTPSSFSIHSPTMTCLFSNLLNMRISCLSSMLGKVECPLQIAHQCRLNTVPFYRQLIILPINQNLKSLKLTLAINNMAFVLVNDDNEAKTQVLIIICISYLSSLKYILNIYNYF